MNGSAEVLFESDGVRASRGSGVAPNGQSAVPPIVLHHHPVHAAEDQRLIILPPRNLYLVQHFVSGFMIVYVIVDVTGFTSMFWSFSRLVPAVVAGAIASNVASTIKEVDSGISMYVQVLCVLTAISWGYVLGIELVAVMGAVGMAFGVGGVIIGITLFMVGCNLGVAIPDFVTNLSLANLGYTSIGVRSSFAAPMLNLVLGLGVSTVWVLGVMGVDNPLGKPGADDDDDDDEMAIDTSTSVLILCYALLGSLVFSAIWLPTHGFKASRRYGFALMAWWGVMMVAALLVETLTAK
ncbi:hypothetical protein HK101_004986 [Irineochytrium annulatum]|nr:hypothetical protein HK101_004986 [Irineochytrium annulatum]